MEKLIAPTFRSYFRLTKPGIIFGNALSAAAGFFFASQGKMLFFPFLATLFGLFFIIGSACAFNNYIDKELDQKMPRTQKRPLASQQLENTPALIFASTLGLLGFLILILFTTPMAFFAGLIGFSIYIIYSFLKYRTPYATHIGSLSGAMPIVAGYSAICPEIDAKMWLLFLTMSFWQMPHFFGIALYRLEDYRSGNIPVLPLTKGLFRTKLEMLFFTIGFGLILALFPYLGYTQRAFSFIMGALVLFWFGLSLYGFFCKDEKRFGRMMFLCSLFIILGFCFSLPFLLA